MTIPNNFTPTPVSRIISHDNVQPVRLQYSDSPELTHTQSQNDLSVIDLTNSTNKPPKHTVHTPATALKQYAYCLTNYEQSEILQYKQIYYCGQHTTLQHKIHGLPHTANNNGYDDSEHELYIVANDQLEYRYEILGLLGRGSFGQVVKVFDHKKQIIVALKIIRNNKKFHTQALTEIKILERLMYSDKQYQSNIIRVYGYFYYRSHLCITFECCYINLYDFLKLNNFNGLTLGLIKRFATQLIQSLCYLQSQSIIHCDLKPENILLKSSTRSTIKLIDFGSSCYINEKLFTYIQSRFYRSPEVILGYEYGFPIDMWSFGCILFELYTGYPLFAGESETEQLMLQMSVLGVPPKSMLQQCDRAAYYFDTTTYEPILQPNSRGKIYPISSRKLQQLLNCTDTNLLDLIQRCLHWDPAKRITPQHAAKHIFLNEHNDTAMAQISQQLQQTHIVSQSIYAQRPSLSLTRQISETQNSRNNSHVKLSTLQVFHDHDRISPTHSSQRKSIDSAAAEYAEEQHVG